MRTLNPVTGNINLRNEDHNLHRAPGCSISRSQMKKYLCNRTETIAIRAKSIANLFNPLHARERLCSNSPRNPATSLLRLLRLFEFTQRFSSSNNIYIQPHHILGSSISIIRCFVA